MTRLEGDFTRVLIQQLQADGCQIFQILNILASTENGKPPTRDHTSLPRYDEIVFEPNFIYSALVGEYKDPQELEILIGKITEGQLTEKELAHVWEICVNYLLSMSIQTITSSQIFQQSGKIVVSMDRG